MSFSFTVIPVIQKNPPQVSSAYAAKKFTEGNAAIDKRKLKNIQK